MKITLINPNLAQQKNDPHTGIPFMPFPLAYLAGHLKQNQHTVYAVDALGESIFQTHPFQGKILRGLLPEQTVDRIPMESEMIIYYARSAEAFAPLKAVIELSKKRFKNCPHVVIENSQAVTSYSLRWVFDEFLPLANYVITGEVETKLDHLIQHIAHPQQDWEDCGIAYKKNGELCYREGPNQFLDLDTLALPDWSIFPIQNYWKFKVSHGPTKGRFLPILTSRGCPYPCKFCVVPDMNNRRWRSASPQRVVEEFAYLKEKYKVDELHLEDLNSTIRKERIQEICKMLIEKKINVRWKLVSGTKIETLDEETIDWMAKAGCTYISFSPESGSPRILKLMDKPFNHKRALELTRHMRKCGIFNQACFVLGFPGEEKADRQETWQYVKKLVHHGISEIALFIMTPVPGSKVYQEHFEALGVPQNVSQLTFSPTWRSDYKTLSSFRKKLYLAFIFWKCSYQPLSILSHTAGLAKRRFNTKMEMIAYRLIQNFFRKSAPWKSVH